MFANVRSYLHPYIPREPRNVVIVSTPNQRLSNIWQKEIIKRSRVEKVDLPNSIDSLPTRIFHYSPTGNISHPPTAFRECFESANDATSQDRTANLSNDVFSSGSAEPFRRKKIQRSKLVRRRSHEIIDLPSYRKSPMIQGCHTSVQKHQHGPNLHLESKTKDCDLIKINTKQRDTQGSMVNDSRNDAKTVIENGHPEKCLEEPHYIFEFKSVLPEKERLQYQQLFIRKAQCPRLYINPFSAIEKHCHCQFFMQSDEVNSKNCIFTIKSNTPASITKALWQLEDNCPRIMERAIFLTRFPSVKKESFSDDVDKHQLSQKILVSKESTEKTDAVSKKNSSTKKFPVKWAEIDSCEKVRPNLSQTEEFPEMCCEKEIFRDISGEHESTLTESLIAFDETLRDAIDGEYGDHSQSLCGHSSGNVSDDGSLFLSAQPSGDMGNDSGQFDQCQLSSETHSSSAQNRNRNNILKAIKRKVKSVFTASHA